jgi:hypothetical protein
LDTAKIPPAFDLEATAQHNVSAIVDHMAAMHETGPDDAFRQLSPLYVQYLLALVEANTSHRYPPTPYMIAGLWEGATAAFEGDFTAADALALALDGLALIAVAVADRIERGTATPTDAHHLRALSIDVLAAVSRSRDDREAGRPFTLPTAPDAAS